jgi:hypothetical protein
MSSAIMPTQQTPLMPVIDLSQQPQAPYQVLDLSRQDQYYPNNQVFMPVSVAPVETHHHTRVRVVFGPLVSGGLTAAFSYALLKLTNYAFGKLKMENFKTSDKWIVGLSALSGIAGAALQAIKLDEVKTKGNHDVLITKGI